MIACDRRSHVLTSLELVGSGFAVLLLFIYFAGIPEVRSDEDVM